MGDPLLAVEGLGQDAGRAGLADPAGTGEEKGVRHPAGIDSVLQGAADMLLAGQFGKGLGTIFPGQDFIRRAIGQERKPHRVSVAPTSRAEKDCGVRGTDLGIGIGESYVAFYELLAGAHDSRVYPRHTTGAAAVASFRTWRSSQPAVARGPAITSACKPLKPRKMASEFI